MVKLLLDWHFHFFDFSLNSDSRVYFVFCPSFDFQLCLALLVQPFGLDYAGCLEG
jgi:hypothetical protein